MRFNQIMGMKLKLSPNYNDPIKTFEVTMTHLKLSLKHENCIEMNFVQTKIVI